MQLVFFIFVISSSLITFLPTYSASATLVRTIVYASPLRVFAQALLSAWSTCFLDILKAHFLHACVFKSLIQCCLSSMVQPDQSLPFRLKPLPPILPILFILLSLPPRALNHLLIHGRISLLHSFSTFCLFHQKAPLWSYFFFFFWFCSLFPKHLEQCLAHNRCSINIGGMNWGNNNQIRKNACLEFFTFYPILFI